MRSPVIALLALLGLVTITATLERVVPAARERLALAISIDFVPWFGLAIVTLLALARFGGAHRMRRITATCSFFGGALISIFGWIHIVAVVLNAIEAPRRHPFVYDFRFYSLIQLGVVLVATGLVAVIQAVHLANGRNAWRALLVVWSAVLAINLPLVPLQRFALLFSALGAVNLMLLWQQKRQDVFPGRRMPTTPAVTATASIAASEET